MKAVVLVGGVGSRLRPLTLTRPKQMLPIGGIAMIERVLSWLSGHGVDEAVLSLGYKPDAFLDAYPDGVIAGVKLVYAVEDEPLDTAGAIRFAADTAGLDETFVVVNGDVLTGLDVTALVEFHRSRDCDATIALTPVEDPSAFGVVPTDSDGRVQAFIEKPSRDEAPTNLINAGTYVLEPAVLDVIPGGRKVSIERETFPRIVAQGRLFAMASESYWLDAGTPASYLAANLEYCNGPDSSCRLGAGAVVEGSVIGASVSIGSNSRVIGSVLMDGVVVGDGCLVSDSILGQAARVGSESSVTALTVLGDGYEVAPASELMEERLPSWS